MEFADQALKHIPKALTVLLIITDGLEQVEKWEKLFRRLPGICRDVRVVTVHSSSEEFPAFEGDVRLVDIENESVIEVSMTKKLWKTILRKKKT